MSTPKKPIGKRGRTRKPRRTSQAALDAANALAARLLEPVTPPAEPRRDE